MRCYTTFSSQFSFPSSKSHPDRSSHDGLCLKGGTSIWFLLIWLAVKQWTMRRTWMKKAPPHVGLEVCGDVGLGQGDGIDVWCARLLMWTEAGGEKEMFLYRYPSLSAHHLAASWPWHHGGPGQKAEETIGSLCWSGACLRPVAATSANKLLVSGFGLTYRVRKWNRSVCFMYYKFWMSPTCFPLITF